MRNKHWRIWSAISILALAILPFPIILMIFNGEISFVPSRFTEEYLKFLGSLSAVLLAFFLVEILWSSQRGSKKAAQIKKIFVINIKNIHNQIVIVKSDIAIKTNKEKEAINRDERILNNFKNLGQLHQEIITILDSNGVALAEDENLESEMFLYLEQIDPVIQKLSLVKSIRLELQSVNDNILKLDNMINDMLQRLGAIQK